jgi:predicted DNA binding CopG/RHH family protein
MSKLTREERNVLKSYERGEWSSSKRAVKEMSKYKSYARSAFQKNKRVNIRLSSQDLEGLQQRAVEEGIPYQTLISSLIHKYVAGGLTERRV